ncbi:MAG: lysophospholipid acyltransferase family protein, partial [Pyrinomonadaceae bacterium]
PSFLSGIGKKGLGILQRAFYERILNTSYEGRSNIPVSQNFLVAANHASHLDMGLVRMALEKYGDDMVALAARDYFFDTKYKRAYMENFTNLVPIERTGSLRKSLRHARSYLERGYNALIFPEGTRSLTGEICEFKSVIGYLALNCKVGILPIYLHGTYEAFPKGANFLKGRNVGARIGRFLEYEKLEEMTRDMARSEAYRLIAAYVRHQVINLRDKTRIPFDAQQHRQSFKAEKQSIADTLATEEFVSVGASVGESVGE